MLLFHHSLFILHSLFVCSIFSSSFLSSRLFAFFKPKVHLSIDRLLRRSRPDSYRELSGRVRLVRYSATGLPVVHCTISGPSRPDSYRDSRWEGHLHTALAFQRFCFLFNQSFNRRTCLSGFILPLPFPAGRALAPSHRFRKWLCGMDR